nr:hypothetical protein CFP56_71386 [Quercus suber]
MAGLGELWSRFSLTEEEEGGAEVSHQVETVIHRLIGNLKKEDQQYGEWLRAKQTRQTKKSVAVISGSARSQGPWGKKYQSASQSKSGHSNDNFLASSQGGCKGDSATVMDADQFMNAVVESKQPTDGNTCEKRQNVGDDNESHNEMNGRVGEDYSSWIEKEVVGLTLEEDNISHSSPAFVLQARPGSLFDCTNQGNVNPAPTKKWKKLACENKSANNSERLGVLELTNKR